jgi:hypothetical protein
VGSDRAVPPGFEGREPLTFPYRIVFVYDDGTSEVEESGAAFPFVCEADDPDVANVTLEGPDGRDWVIARVENFDDRPGADPIATVICVPKVVGAGYETLKMERERLREGGGGLG